MSVTVCLWISRERLSWVSDQGVAEYSRDDSLFKSGDHHVFVMGVESHRECLEPVQVFLQRFPLSLCLTGKRSYNTRGELLPKYPGELCEKGYVAIKESTEPLQRAVPMKVLMNILHRTAFDPPEMIIWALKAVRWF